MPRPLRTAPGGLVYHVLNRATGKRRIFEHDRDYLAFERDFTKRGTLSWLPFDHWRKRVIPDLLHDQRATAWFSTHTVRL